MKTSLEKYIEVNRSEYITSKYASAFDSYKEGANLLLPMLLKACEALENYAHVLNTYQGKCDNTAERTLKEIREALESVK